MFYDGAARRYESDYLLDRVSHRKEKEDGTWQLERCQPVFPCLVGIHPSGLPRGFVQAERGSIVCLRPGESWTDALEAFDGDPWEFPPDLAYGDVFRLQHRGI
ncbi:hypothetical protein BDW68DRAFT_158059 [Aspergillus falconensis]